jgi:lipopolysaccharide transport system permease protein
MWYGVGVSLKLLWLPLFGLQAITTALAVALWLSALNVKYRDVRYVVPFMTQFWLFATPVAYPSSLLDEPWRTIFGLNPMVGVVEGFRWALLDTGTAPGPMLAVSSVVSLILLVGGAYYFRRLERTFADRV